MNDRELLEMAARAYLPGEHFSNKAYMLGFMSNWNPITDSGDALRLAVELDIGVRQSFATVGNQEFFGESGDDINTATRRAIVRAAAAIGAAL